MKRILVRSMLTLAVFSIAFSSYAYTNASLVIPKENKADNMWAIRFKDVPEVKTLSPQMMKLGMDQFLSLTPSKYKKLTGHKLGLKKSIELKAAQKFVKMKMSAASGEMSKGLYIVLAILGLGFIGLGVLSDWSGNNWWVCLLLSLLCWLPGVIYALVKMKDYYK